MSGGDVCECYPPDRGLNTKLRASGFIRVQLNPEKVLGMATQCFFGKLI